MDFFKAYRINMISYKSCTVNCTEGLPLKECIHLEIFSNGPVAKHYTKLNSEVTMIKGRIYRHVHVALFFKIKKPEHTRRDQLTCTFIFSSKYNLKRYFCFQQQKREGQYI